MGELVGRAVMLVFGAAAVGISCSHSSTTVIEPEPTCESKGGACDTGDVIACEEPSSPCEDTKDVLCESEIEGDYKDCFSTRGVPYMTGYDRCCVPKRCSGGTGWCVQCARELTIESRSPGCEVVERFAGYDGGDLVIRIPCCASPTGR